MAKKNDSSQQLEQMLAQVRQTEAKGTPKQKVVPVIEKEKETSLGILLPVSLKNFIKLQAVNENLPIKDIILNAVREKYKDIL